MKFFYCTIIFFTLNTNFCYSQVCNTVGGGADLNCNGVQGFIVFDSILRVCGNFGTVGGGTIPTVGIATWDGSQWNSFGFVTKGSEPKCFTIHNNELYIAGGFDEIDSNKYCKGVAHWDGIQWQPLSKGVTNGVGVYAMTSYNGDLYVGGQFTQVDSTIPAYRIARWNGSQWYAMGTGFTGGITQVQDMVVYNNELIVAGYFSSIDGLLVNNICRWNGTNWDSLGSGLDFITYSLVVDTINNLLYAAGSFYLAGGIPCPSGVAVWDGASWAPVGGPPHIGSYDLEFYRGKLFNATGASGVVNALGDTIDYFAYYDGVHWIPPIRISQAVAFDMEVYNNELYVGGYFDYACDSLVRHIFRYYESPAIIEENVLTVGDFLVSPNPLIGEQLNITYKLSPNQSGIFEMFDVNGRKVYSQALPKWSTMQVISLPVVADGVYNCVLKSDSARSSRKLIIMSE